MCYGTCQYEKWDGECHRNLDRLPADAACMQDMQDDLAEDENNLKWLKELEDVS